MGSVEVFYFWLTASLLTYIVIKILSCFSVKYFLNRFGILRSNRREFYECGFKPIVQKVPRVSIRIASICFLFLIYDTELLFSFPLVSSASYLSYIEIFFFITLYLTFIVSLVFDFKQSGADWKI